MVDVADGFVVSVLAKAFHVVGLIGVGIVGGVDELDGVFLVLPALYDTLRHDLFELGHGADVKKGVVVGDPCLVQQVFVLQVGEEYLVLSGLLPVAVFHYAEVGLELFVIVKLVV